ncbi:DegQ family serine endoprotease [Neisseria elongata]|uniref:Probable periplasmic serine endoprotease DegP-like n=1 Tax=Neisseria elongata subsp. nitroreducens TaxID=90367 RepID=A0A9X0ZU64_NEIEL|nr:DegQ family serine endoprotease [Neisseria elongata subsp. nitroreducens]MBS9339675.1 DegQ family serine endoprotease [Neisseria elongata subsp. nitroreducens]
MNRHYKYLALTAAVLLALTACGKEEKNNDVPAAKPQEQVFAKPVEAQTSQGKVDMLLPDFTKLMEQEGATVVNIQATKQTENNADQADHSPFPEDDPFYDFFKRLVPNAPQLQDPDEDKDQNFGSGFIISANGYILTNSHVVSGMNNIKVTLNDKREFSAKLIGSDTQSDVALLKIEAEGLPTVKIGDVKTLRIGEWVAAIGAPFGFENSITAGIVSAKGRSLPNENYTPFIQTDVAINPGNSGGPLFNLNGQVVGINSQIYSRSGGFMGISFAIPIDVAMNVADQLRTTGKVQRGRLGVIIQEVNYNLAKSFGLSKPMGALITQVMPDGPAAQAGLKQGDVVLSVNGEEVRASNDLPVMVGSITPGKEITLQVWRNGEVIEQKILLDNADKNNGSRSGHTGGDDGTNLQNQSFTLDNIGLTLAEQITGDKHRLLVLRADKVAAQAGLKRGDYILSVGQNPVTDEASMRGALEKAGNNIPLLVQRGENTLFLALNLQ